ncbi:MAG: helix-turn-helix transcriptional regulator [Rikenellaceae bacterium]|nr:helix-turn-helix transcriptional regulator [Rikenellaceae bacterium]
MKQIRDQELLRGIAVKMKRLREQRGISQEMVYADTQIHVARIETARVNISVSTLSAICKYFDISLAEFFEDL